MTRAQAQGSVIMNKETGLLKVFKDLLFIGTLGVMLAWAFAGCGDEETTTESTTPATTKTATTSTTKTTTTSREDEFEAKLEGSQVVPSVNTEAEGEAKFNLTSNGTALAFSVKVENIVDVNAAHIHLGQPGSNGEIVVPLFSGNKSGEFSGTLAEGTISAADLTGSLAGKSISDLLAKIQAGDTYVNVHTAANPAGEIRGQIKSS